MIYTFFIALLIGIITEWIAYKNNFWEYRKLQYLVFNILVMFMLIQGGIAFLCVSGVEEFSLLRLISYSLIGSTVGIIYENCNEYFVRLFDFGKEGVLFLKTKKQLIWGIGISWGGIPLASSLIYWWLM